MNDLIRLRPSGNGPAPMTVDDFDTYLLARREVLADELRTVEEICMRRKIIKRLLCAPGKVKP